ncbi:MULTISPECIES: hypothetical protein [Rhizobium]|uniref:hypothetical protein n=1 Tax=Rhizobium phaseoli TaxID=396 RepID=UPI0004D93AF7|nr:hypothetical protein [Rhizobium phaseoli]ANL34344.1 hypothetical protein AMC89_CH02287 [Rhizobium phaseoli]ANL98067.1 hypothetical protein AMC79_CH02280 [Rhizobium phaseoli]KEC75712.1 hypothetical protein RLPCCGM1_c1091 [Rhizobium leguminosarum bv. phaseoli CCGM1]PWI54330.1 hypothetical protein B5K03_11205 [Rhizobium phaseoli]
MGLIAMSERDLQRIEVLSKVIAGRMTLVSAAHVLDPSTHPCVPTDHIPHWIVFPATRSTFSVALKKLCKDASLSFTLAT